MFLIEHHHAPIGIVGIDWREPDAPELGYWLGVEHWGRGFGTEAARAVIDFTFEEFDVEHLISGARVTNPSSRNILEKCGFQWSGVELHRFEALGSSTPVDCFRLSRSVWSSLKNWSSSTRQKGEPSSRRTPGPITLGFACCQRICHRNSRRAHGARVAAFAGTTMSFTPAD